MRSDISYISHPDPIRCADVEVLLQSISCSHSRPGAILTRAAFIADLGPQAFAAHELGNRVGCARLAQAYALLAWGSYMGRISIRSFCLKMEESIRELLGKRLGLGK